MSRSPIRLIGLGAFAMAGGYGPLVGSTFGILMGLWVRDQEWSRGHISLAITISTLAFAVGQVATAKLIERYGARGTVTASMAGMAVILILTAAIEDVRQLWLAYLALGFVGAATSGVPYVSAIYAQAETSPAFLASVVVASGAGLGFFLWPLAISIGASALGWRLTMIIVGCLVLTTAVPAAWHFFTVSRQRADALDLLRRERSERCAPPSNAPCLAPNSLAGENRPRLPRCSSYWVFIGWCFIGAVGFQSVIVHFVPILVGNEFGLSPAATVASLLGWAIVPSLILAGRLADRYRPEALAAAYSLCAASGIALLLVASASAAHLAVIAVCLMGAGFGFEMLIPQIIRHRFSSADFVRAYSLAFGCYVLGRAVGPWGAGVWRDRAGDYHGMLKVAGITVAATAVYLAYRALRGSSKVKDMQAGGKDLERSAVIASEQYSKDGIRRHV